MKKRSGIAFIIFLLCIWIAGCSSSTTSSPKKESEKLQVYVSLYPLEDFTKKIGGNHVQVTNVIPSGVEPHDFELTAKDIANLNEADLFVYQGAGFDSIKKVADSLDPNKVVDVSKGIELLKGEEHGHDHEHGKEEKEHHDDHGAVDPHVWLDPQLAKKQAQQIRDALIKADDKHQADYQKNYDQLAAQLDKLDQEFQEMAKKAKHKTFVTSHAAFGYLAKRYGLEQVAVNGLSPTEEPSPQELKEVIEMMKKHQVKYILFETLVSAKVAETVKQEVKAESLILNPLEGLTQQEINQKVDYFSVMRKNKENLAKALGVSS
ncbi:metal ABC transporter substrate-binding protein [Thermoflavimicrobium dichotomicum]|uniref:Zinc transport system substrate-binding protein n=1 Tax=Thermoflavimicrobium dichotomicum TaxID=46223 RepID=A0A1I3KJ45_9BACL|nr:metal ABC transporter substrate-binding protein [Thermoflavimicrobium dichotomicum]SFI72499.1 zinc transport system substrate-binding protein [Thermoflavimicrobium dichotomicum]